MMRISIANDFSDVPGPRSKIEGANSAEEFLEQHLRPMFLKARSTNGQLLVDLDGGFGYATSFLEEAFGGLAREFGVEEVQRVVIIKSDEEPYLKDDVEAYIREANTGAQVGM